MRDRLIWKGKSEQPCTQCGNVKPLSEFGKKEKGLNGRNSMCLPCDRAYSRERLQDPAKKRNHISSRLKSVYGITMDDYELMHASQDSRCWICQREEKEIGSTLHIDHCHSTGIIRGLLCFKCNAGLGRAKDSQEILQAAIEYLS